ncbi:MULTISPECIES: DegQ family serine endoprotease [Neisseria]|uniref:Probable periplasmic serine endoprotease DegP-like n=1 Tax=Neisseria dumasiana TaxID=1931275 RepID=A0A1X3DHF3_9NEIS|nr:MULTISPECIES: DegQ family serine endoprotease [Neisseria]KPN74516.1 protease Do [Neisseria sp. 74A18]OSI20368.1 protease Do [Neisseria dumasiana]OSI35383.1 protease Do [Neisseria dumasiana]UOO85013.1 DegQ family serine endoprotease [Neisseria dumasiana]
MNKTPKYIALVLASALVLNGCDKVDSFFGKQDEPQKDLVQKVETQTDSGKVEMLLPDFTKLVEQEGQTVVNIQALQAPRAGRSNDNMDLNQFPDNDPFYEFFKRLVPNLPDIPEQEDDTELHFGSGFIISPDGYILTNTHVVGGMSNIKVLLNDKREYTAKLIGSDVQSDVALLKIDAENLPVIKVGNAKDLKPGEWVAAIGAPFGFDNSVTAGIVSAKGRSLPNENYTPFIQTDVAINPGNSGGPLFNLKGQVVGINSQIYSRSGGFMGISFAIPIDVAMNVAEQLKAGGKVQRGQLGVIIQEVSYNLAKSFGLEKASGALITRVLPNSPALKAGLQSGDIVRSVNGEEVRQSSDLPVMVGAIAPGKEVTLNVWRKGKEQQIKVILGASGNDTETSNAGNNDPMFSTDGQAFAVEAVGLTMKVRTSNTGKRLVVVKAEGPAERAGLRRGDEIVTVNHLNVEDEATLKSALEGAGKNIPLLVERNGDTIFMALTLP